MTTDIYSKFDIDLRLSSVQYGGEADLATIVYVDERNGIQDLESLDVFTGDQLQGEADEYATIAYVDEGNVTQDNNTAEYATGTQLTGSTL